MRVVWIVSLCLALLLLFGAASASVPAHISASSAKKMPTDFASSISTKAQGEMVRVIITYKPNKPDAKPLKVFRSMTEMNVSEKVRLYGGSVRYEYSMTPSISASVPAGMIDAIASDSAVDAIYPVRTYYISRPQATPLIKADVAALYYGVNGTGINISIIDTGIYNHAEFQTPSRIVKQKCYCTGCCAGGANEAGTADDDEGHGTHVAGIAAGQGNPTYGYGVATNASLFAVKVCSSAGVCISDDIIKGIEWSAQNGANIISMSLGGAVSSDCYEDYIGNWVDNLTAQGILFVIAAGNCGPGGSSNPAICPSLGDDTIESPGCAKSALTVGATDKQDNTASYSSRGSTLDNRTKPDVVATGSSITSTYNNGGYTSASGTSMATPFVSGEAALIMQRHVQVFGYMPDPSLVKAIIMTGVNATSQRNNTYGSGRIDVNKSLGIMAFSQNGSLVNGQMINKTIRIKNGTFIVTLYWPENSSTSNNLDLIVGNSTVNFTQATDANDTVEQVTLFNALEGVWNIYVNGTNATGSQRYFLVWSESVSVPYWYSNRTITTAVYNQSNLSYFNITWGGRPPIIKGPHRRQLVRQRRKLHHDLFWRGQPQLQHHTA